MPKRPLSPEELAAIEDEVVAKAPAGLTDEEFDRYFGPKFAEAQAVAEHSSAPLQGSSLKRALSGIWQTANPVAIAGGLYQAVRHPIQTADAVMTAHGEQFDKAKSAFGEGRYTEAAGHASAAALPIVGPVAAQIGDQIGAGDVAGGMGAAAGVLGTAAVAGPAVRAAGRAVGNTAVPLVRSATKPTVSAMRQQAGASVTGLDAVANRLAQFIADRGLATPQQAQDLVMATEQRIQRVAGAATSATDAPQRAERYLRALSQSASRQGLPTDDVAIIRGKAAELLADSPLSETVMQSAMQPSPAGLVTPSGQPVMVPTQVPTRALRTDVMPAEALEIARGGGRWGNRKSWGEQKGAAREASKAVERAGRDATKAAVPETRDMLREQGQAIQARDVLGRMKFREGNREPISPFDVTTAAVELGSGQPPILSLARSVLREKKLEMGIWARRLERAINTHDEAAAATILDRFGVLKGVDQATSPSERPSAMSPAWSTP